LHGTISTKRHPVAVPAVPMSLDGVLVDTPLTGGPPCIDPLGPMHGFIKDALDSPCER